MAEQTGSEVEREVQDEINTSPFVKVLEELSRVKAEHRLVVIIAHGFVELMVNALIDAKCRNAKKITNNNRDFPHSAKLTILNEMGVLSDHHYELLNWFRKLRNDAAHEPMFTLNQDRLSIFAKPEQRDISKFHMLCTMILLDMWKSHEDVIGPKFLPGAYKEEEQDVLMVEYPAPPTLIQLVSDPKTIKRPVS